MRVGRKLSNVNLDLRNAFKIKKHPISSVVCRFSLAKESNFTNFMCVLCVSNGRFCKRQQRHGKANHGLWDEGYIKCIIVIWSNNNNKKCIERIFLNAYTLPFACSFCIFFLGPTMSTDCTKINIVCLSLYDHREGTNNKR